MKTVFESDIKGCTLVRRGKVRDIYDTGDPAEMLIVACDRISAFDCILPTPIPGKGALLTSMANFWFGKTTHIVKNHLLDTAPENRPALKASADELSGRAVVVKKTETLPVEAIVRGYVSGSAWKEYKTSGGVGGMKLPDGLSESDKLPEPVFTPSTKADVGMHDENISYEKMRDIIGAELAEKVRDTALALYTFAADHARGLGIIIADTKFEFGMLNGELILIDEILTPDSSRFWPLDLYKPGGPQPSYDKQFVRDYLETLDWNKQPPAPPLPADVVEKTVEKYREALTRLAG